MGSSYCVVIVAMQHANSKQCVHCGILFLAPTVGGQHLMHWHGVVLDAFGSFEVEPVVVLVPPQTVAS